MSDDLKDVVLYDCGFEQVDIEGCKASPSEVPIICRYFVKSWVGFLKSAWPTFNSSLLLPKKHYEFLDIIAQVVGFRSYKALFRALRKTNPLDGQHAKNSEFLGNASLEVLSAVAPLTIRLRQDEHPSQLQQPYINRLADQLSKIIPTPLSHAEEFFVRNMRSAQPKATDWKAEHRLSGIKPEYSPEPYYTFWPKRPSTISGWATYSPIKGNFVRSHDATITERNLRMTISKHRGGSSGIEHVIEMVNISILRNPSFLAGKFILAGLMLEHGEVLAARKTYEEAVADARALFQADSEVLIAHSTDNNFYLLGMENLARTYLYTGDFVQAMKTLKALHRHASDDDERRAQCLYGIIASASHDDKDAMRRSSLLGEPDSLPLTSFFRALVYCGASCYDDAAEELAEALVRQPMLALALQYGIAEDDQHFRNSDLQYLLERRPDIRDRIGRAMAVPSIGEAINDLQKAFKLTGSFKESVLYWPEDEAVPLQVKHMQNTINKLTPKLSRAMQQA